MKEPLALLLLLLLGQQCARGIAQGGELHGAQLRGTAIGKEQLT